jgi:menaquinone-specific isochorismate synthase
VSSVALRHRALVARTRWLAEPVDPFAGLDPSGFAWWRDGSGFVARGVAARVPPGEVEATLATIAVDDAVRVPGSGPIAVGALPYRATGAASLVVPAEVVARTPEGRTFVTELGADPVPVPVPASRPVGPTSYRVRRGMSRGVWDGAVEQVLAEIAGERVEKVVLARDVRVEADVPFDVAEVARGLRASQPGCFVFVARGLVGASPELLVARHGAVVRCRPLAGTSPGVAGDAPARLAASVKDGAEHRIVVDAVVAALAGQGATSLQVRGPAVERFADLAHLATEIAGRLPERAGPSALALARALHPTPAVAGSPADRAEALIARLEPGDRGRYAGPVGWVDSRGDGEWAVALRSAEVDGCTALLRAGAGIVAGSEAAAEWRETEAKFAPMLAALVRG